MRQLAFAALLAASLPQVSGAQALFIGGKSESAILLYPEEGKGLGQLQFNSVNSVVQLSFQSRRFSQERAGAYPVFYALVLNGKATGNSTTLWANNAIGQSIGGRLAVRVVGLLADTSEFPNQYNEIAFTLGVSQQSNKLYDPVAKSFRTDRLTSLTGAMNVWKQLNDQRWLAGARVGFGRESNVEDLTSYNVVTQQTTTVGGVSQTFDSTTSAVLANQYSERNVVPLRFDVLYNVPTRVKAEGKGKYQNLGVGLFARKADLNRGDWEPGLALLLAKPGAPFVFQGGLTASWRDGKATVGVFAGYSF
jgi:hypothetical protein